MSNFARMIARTQWRSDCPPTFDITRKNRNEVFRFVPAAEGEEPKPPKLLARRLSFKRWRKV